MYEPLFRGLLFPLYEGLLRRRRTLAHLREYERTQWLPREQVDALQWQRLSRLVAYCWNEVPYYRRRWGAAGVGSPADIRGVDDYARLPVLTKQDVRDHFDDLLARPARGSMLFKTTGGSTGEPLRIGYTRENYERRNAVMHRGYAWAGAPLGRRALHLWGEPPGVGIKARLQHAAFNRRVLDVFRMRDDNLVAYADAIDAHRPRVIVAYVASAVRLAQWLIASGRRVHVPDAVLCAAEPLRSHQRALIEEAFGCPVFNTYGCREFALIASECEHRQGLHVNADHLRVELGDPATPAGDAGPREVLVTDLFNYGMPLMRYANGDLATASASDAACPCGRGLPVLASVDGRRMDALRTPEGHYVGEYLEYLMFTTPGVRRFQAVQERIDRIDVAVVGSEELADDALDQVRRRMIDAFGSSVELAFARTGELPLTPTGKLRVAVSKLAHCVWMTLLHAVEAVRGLGLEAAVAMA